MVVDSRSLGRFQVVVRLCDLASHVHLPSEYGSTLSMKLFCFQHLTQAIKAIRGIPMGHRYVHALGTSKTVYLVKCENKYFHMFSVPRLIMEADKTIGLTRLSP